MLRLGIFISALIGVFLVALSLMPRFLSPSVYRTQALIGLTRALGQPVEAGDGAAITLLPRPKLQLTDVRVRGDGANINDILLSADTATFDLYGQALARGKFMVEAVELDRPVMSLSRSEDHSVTFGASPLFTGLTGTSDETSTLNRLTLKDGELHYYDEPFGQNFRFDIDELAIERVSGYAFEATGSVRSEDEPFGIAISFVPNANPGGERNFNIDLIREDQSVVNLRGAIDEKFGESLIIREDLDWKLTAENFQHPLFDRLAIADGQGVNIEARLLSDREGYDLRGLTLTRDNGEQMRGSARFVPSGEVPTVGLSLMGRGFTLSNSAAELPLRDWTALLPGAVADLGGVRVDFDIAAQDFRLPNGEIVERLKTQGTLEAGGLSLSSLKGKTESGLSLDLASLQVAGPDDLQFKGRLITDDATRFANDGDLAELIGSLGRLNFDGSVELVDGGLVISQGVVTTAQGAFNVSGMPFALDAATGFGQAGIELVTESLDLNAWTQLDSNTEAETDLAAQFRAITQRMRVLRTDSLSLIAEQANLGGRILDNLDARFSTRPSGETDIVASFTEDDGTRFDATGTLADDGQTLDYGQVGLVLNREPRAAEKAITRFAPAAMDNPLVRDILDRLPIDALTFTRTDPSRPWEMALRSGETVLSGSDVDATGNRFWTFSSDGASDLFQALDIPFSPIDEAGDVQLSGRQSEGELVGIGRMLGAEITLQELNDTADEDVNAGRAFQLRIKHDDAQGFLDSLGFNLALPPSTGPIDITLSVSRVDQNYGYRVDAALGDMLIRGNGFYGFETKNIAFDGEVNQIEVLPLLNALFIADAEDSVLSPALSSLSGQINLSVEQLGPLADASVAINFTPGRYTVEQLKGTFADGLLAGGELSVDGDVLAGADIFADLTVEVVGAAPQLGIATDTGLAFDTLSFRSNSFQARAQSMAEVLNAVDASFDVEGTATMALALTAINAASDVEEGLWKDFLSGGEGISAYEDLRSLFFDGDATLDGVVILSQGVMQTNSLALKGRQGTLLAKGAIELETLDARGFVPDEPLRVELYRAEDSQLVEQVLLLTGSLAAPDALSIER
jgi:hypothetical protein